MVKVVLIGQDESLCRAIMSQRDVCAIVVARYPDPEQFARDTLDSNAYDLVLASSQNGTFDSLEGLPQLRDKKLALMVSSQTMNALYYYRKIKVLIRLESMQEVLKLIQTLFAQTNTPASAAPRLCNPYELPTAKTKLVVKKGDEYSTFAIDDAVYFFSENRIIYVVDQHGRKYMTEYMNLEDLLHHMNAKDFFKANRKMVINLKHVVKFRRISKSKYQLQLTAPSKEPLYITPLNMAAFNERIRSL